MDINRFRGYLFWYVGFNATLYIFRDTIVAVKFAYTTSIIILALYSLSALRTKSKTGSYIFSLKMLSIILSLLVCLFQYKYSFFENEVIGLLPMFLMWCVSIRKPDENDCKMYLNGYRVSLIVNFIYATIQIYTVYFMNFDINAYLFHYVGYRDNIVLDLKSTRITGLCWDAYLLGMFCATGFFLFENKILKIYILSLLLFSSSRAGMVGLAVAAIFFYWDVIKRYIPIAICLIIGFAGTINTFLSLDRGMSKDSIGWRRVEYVTMIPAIWNKDETIVPIVLGGAVWNSGARFFYSKIKSVTNDTSLTPNWAIETDWCSILLGRGILGFVVYLICYTYIFATSKNRQLKALAICFFAGGVGYYYEYAIFSNFIFYFAINLKHGKSLTQSNNPSLL